MNEKIISFQAVDLGLSVLWADRNLGASLPSVDGYHYRWGDLSLWKNENFYYQKGVFDNISNNIGGNPNFDAARYECGEPWRLPSLSEINELIHCCTWIWQEADDVNFVLSGYKVFGMNGNHIFFPASGQGEGLMEDESYIEHFDIYGCYWSGNLCEDKYMAYELRFRKDAISVYPQWRSRGNCIRPVCIK